MTTDIYQAQNLPPAAFNDIKALYIDTMATLEGAALEVDYLKSAIKMLQNGISGSVNAKIKKADITCKYTHKTPGQNYAIPTIDNPTQADYSYDAVKNDNKNFEALEQDVVQLNRQTDLYQNMVVSNAKDLQSKLAKIQQNLNTMNNYMAQLETYSYGNLKK